MPEFTIPEIASIDEEAKRKTQQILDNKTKPRGSLGRLEALAGQIAAIHGTSEVAPLQKAVVVLAGDHGVARSGVSAYPQEVSRQMLLNFAAGGAAVNVLARAAGARVVAVDMGVTCPVHDPAIEGRWLGPGTKNLEVEAAMTQEQAVRGVELGVGLANDLIDQGISLVALGEMGIGNTTSASALTHLFTGSPVAEVTGRGTGIDDRALQRKIEVIEAGVRRCGAGRNDPWQAMREVGGFEIAGLAGVAIGAAARRVPVLLDGFITGAAALFVDAVAPEARPYFIAAHRSAEPGHQIALRKLRLSPLLELGLRLGEGSGAALAFPILDAAVRILTEMATFADAGVSSSEA
jgi:nicotinate-nucleotide--dimethylbenzimidazole phosphoribosyltransferase